MSPKTLFISNLMPLMNLMYSQKTASTKKLKKSLLKNLTKKNRKKLIQIFNKLKPLMRMIPKKHLRISQMLRLMKIRRRRKNFLKTK